MPELVRVINVSCYNNDQEKKMSVAQHNQNSFFPNIKSNGVGPDDFSLSPGDSVLQIPFDQWPGYPQDLTVPLGSWNCFLYLPS